MKKIIIVLAFVFGGVMLSNAQTANTSNETPTVVTSTSTSNEAGAESPAKKESKSTPKAHCSKSSKKSCAKATKSSCSSKKSCCSKSKAVKED